MGHDAVLTTLREDWLAATTDELAAAIELRHRLHADPRCSGDEADTAQLVADTLAGGDGTRVAGTGRAIALDHGPASSGEMIALRAELDALPLTERTGVPWAAGTGAMHACGHDVHLAALVAVCRAARRVALPVPILALLQPREETSPSGAADIVSSGLLTERRVRAVIGAHVQPRLPAGTVSAVAGPVNASTDEFEVVVDGHGGHAGYPHTLRDPVLALCQIVVSLQQLASRRIDPINGAVCSVGQLQAGSAANVIPTRASARGSVRLMRAQDRQHAHELLAEITESTARAHGCTAELRVLPCEPVLYNDLGLASRAARWLSLDDATVDTEFRSFGADDFSHYCEAAPGLMMFVGVPGERGLHDERFLPPDDTIEHVARSLVAGYLAALGTP